jgi:DNA helicase-2/ATP-dependent DNA helicase PcrA
MLDTTASWLLVRKNFDRFVLDYYRPLGNPTKFIHALLQHFSRAKDEGVMPEDYLRYAHGLRLSADAEHAGAVGQEEIKRAEELANAYHVYQQLLLEQGALDFGDLLIYTRELFMNRPGILEQYRAQFRFILVDEFQDTNWIQYEIVKLLAAPRNNLTVVGDDDQAVFLFRGASYHNIIQFKKDYPASAHVFLTQNYRSCQNILDSAYACIQLNNPDRLEWQLRQGQGSDQLSKRLCATTTLAGTIEHMHCATLDEEHETVWKKILELKENDPDLLWSDCAILTRANDAAQLFGRSAENAGIPYYIVTLKGLYTKPIILDILAYCTVVLRPHASPALWRVLSMPHCALSASALIALSHYASKHAHTLIEACQKVEMIPDVGADDRAVVKKILSQLERHAISARTKPAIEVLLTLIRDAGMLANLTAEDTQSTRESLKYLDALVKKARDIISGIPDARLSDVLEIFQLEQESGEQGNIPRSDDSGPDAVPIMTVHSAKGLEFRHVFIVNMVDRRFPTTMRPDAIELPRALMKEITPEGDAHMEEERRLFYVAMTRAKESIFFTSSSDVGGVRKKKISRFLHEAGVVEEKTKILASTHRHAEMVTRMQTENRQDSLSTDRNAVALPIPSVFSYSQLAAFQKCPLQYKFAFVLKIPVFGKPSLSFGRTLHLTLQRFFQSIRDSSAKDQQSLFNTGYKAYTTHIQIPTLDDLLDMYARAWVDEWYAGKKQRDEYYQRGRDILKRIHDECCRQHPTPTALEQDFTIKVGSAGNLYTIKGRIDRIDVCSDGSVEIIDYKTGAGKETLERDDKDQLLYYQIASQEVLGQHPSNLTYYYLESGNKLSFLGTDEDSERLKIKAVSLIEQIRASDFPPNPGWNCKFCDFRDICEYRK